MSDLVGERESSLIINSEQVIKPFLVLNIYFTYSYQWLIARVLFYKSIIKSNCILFLSHVLVKAFLEILQNSRENACARVSFLKKRFCHRCFPMNLAKFLRISFLTEHMRWLLLAFHSESTLYSFRTCCSKQAQYLKFKWTRTSWKYNRSNIVQTSFLCYVGGFYTPSVKMCSAKED